jgi:hypothetical protein
MFTVNYVLQQVLLKSWYILPERATMPKQVGASNRKNT